MERLYLVFRALMVIIKFPDPPMNTAVTKKKMNCNELLTSDTSMARADVPSFNVSLDPNA